MLISIRLLICDPSLRLVALGMFLIGAINASLYPYQSLIAIQRIGLTATGFSALLIIASALAVLAALSAGILADQKANRRRIALLTATAALIGPLLMLLHPGFVSLILCHAILLPVSASLYGQLFALARLALRRHEALRDPVLSLLRAGLSLTFVSMLTLWSVVFARGIDVMAVYFSAAIAAATLLMLIWLRWPRDGQTHWDDAPSGLSLKQSLAEIAQPNVLGRLTLLGAISSASVLYMVLVSLVFDAESGRDASDVALFVGMVAGWEVPFMLALPILTRRMRRSTLLAAGGAIYASYLFLMPQLAASRFVWGLPLVAGLGGAAILTLPIAYLQDLMSNRPGTASALMAVQKIIADACAASAFAIGMGLGGFGLTAAIGAAIALMGCLTLLWVDRRL